MKYKLIKLLPFENSPRIGYTSEPHLSQKDRAYYWNGGWFNPENHPEFWELVVEKDYEILSFTNSEKAIYTKGAVGRFDARYQMYRPTEEDCLKEPGFKIHSVKRLSDGEIFTSGDRIANMCNSEQNITELYINKDGKMCVYTSTTCRFTIDNIKKVKTPLFTTEDGVDIFDKDKFWILRTNKTQ